MKKNKAKSGLILTGAVFLVTVFSFWGIRDWGMVKKSSSEMKILPS